MTDRKQIPDEVKYKGDVLFNQYNPDIYVCKECDNRHIDFNDKHCVGFVRAPFLSDVAPYTNIYAVIWECPDCFTIQWCHCGWKEIEHYLEYLKEKDL